MLEMMCLLPFLSPPISLHTQTPSCCYSEPNKFLHSHEKSLPPPPLNAVTGAILPLQHEMPVVLQQFATRLQAWEAIPGVLNLILGIIE